nr:beta-adaptin-like protein B [Tanacetum cinerariifolium]
NEAIPLSDEKIALDAASSEGSMSGPGSRREEAEAEVPQMQPETTERTLLPMVMFQNIARGPPNSLLHVAIKNNQQPVWYFTDDVSMLVLFMVEDVKMECGTFLNRSLPDSKEVSKDIPDILINSVDETIERLPSSNMFFIAKRKKEKQHVLYISARVHNGFPLLIELTLILGSPSLKCAIKSSKSDTSALVFKALKTLLRS